jgi:hypothetical protein
MKSIFIKPKITIEKKVILEKPLCGSLDKRAAEWGFSEKSYFTNSDWYNEGYDGSFIGIDPGDIAAQSKERGGEWGNLW